MKMRMARCMGLMIAALSLQGGEHPNIVVILADDYGYGSAGCYGADRHLIQTPNIDRLAREGRRFTDANTTSSVCTPTRYSLMTGRYCWRTSLTHEVLGTFSPLHIETNRLTLASLLKRRGYATAAVGKWHLGYGASDDSFKWRTDYTAELSPGPLDVGFDYHFGVPSNHGDLTGIFVEGRYVYGLRSGKIPESMKASPVPDADNFQDAYGPEDTESGRAKILDLDAPRRKNTRVMAVLAGRAVRWLERQPKAKPFFLYFAPVAVHSPVTPDTDIAGQSKAGTYGDWIRELDRSVGTILDALDRLGVAQNTLVLFTSDNGGVFTPARVDIPQTQAAVAGLKINGIWRGGKHNVWEGGFKVPFVVRWPGRVKPGSVSAQTVSLADVLATVAEVLEEPLPPVSAGAEDSVSFLAALLGDPDTPARDHLIIHSADGTFAIRQGPWKWIEGEPVDDIAPGARKQRADEYHPQLYNLIEDPVEACDVSAAHPEVVAHLQALLNRCRDGGYSRVLPPADVTPHHKVVSLPALARTPLLEARLDVLPSKPWVASAGAWSVRDGGVWGVQKAGKDQGATLRVPVSFTNGVVDYEICFDGADRHSQRIDWGDGTRGGSFRVVISRRAIEIAKNPSRGEGADAVEPVARKALKLQKMVWYPVRLTFQGRDLRVQVNDTVVVGAHDVFGQPKAALNFLVFGDSAGFRNVKVVK